MFGGLLERETQGDLGRQVSGGPGVRAEAFAGGVKEGVGRARQASPHPHGL
jgi:hypothetical protein